MKTANNNTPKASDKIYSSCAEVNKLLSQYPLSSFFICSADFAKPNSDLLRAYIACQQGLEVSPLSKGHSKLYVTPEQYSEEMSHVKSMQK